jgi:hypothetical protein
MISVMWTGVCWTADKIQNHDFAQLVIVRFREPRRIGLFLPITTVSATIMRYQNADEAWLLYTHF